MIWTSRLFWKVVLTTMGFIAFFSILLGNRIAERQRQDLKEQLNERLRVSAIHLGTVVQPLLVNRDLPPITALVRQLGNKTGTRLSIIDVDGSVIADSGLGSAANVSEMDNHRNRKEVVEAMQAGSGSSERISTTLDKLLYYQALRIDGDTGPLGVARAAMSVDSVESQVSQVRRILWLCAIAAGIFSGFTAYVLVHRMHNQIERLAGAANAIAIGRHRQQIHVRSFDEIGHLAESIQQMSKEIDQRINELQSRNDQLAAILGGTIEGVIAIDQKMRILVANDSAATMLQCSPGSAMGRPLIEIVRDETLRRVVAQAMTQREVVKAEIGTLKDGRSTMAVSATPLPGDPCTGVVVILYDITELRRLESLRQEFVANVSHELKTPLSAIRAYAETLRDGAIHDPTINMRFVERIDEQAHRLQQLIFDVISLARIESGQQAFEITDVSLDQAVKNCLESHRSSADARQISLQAADQLPAVDVHLDEEALREILDNLIDNAIKYTPERGQVRVSWVLQNQYVILEIADTGIGISEADQRRIFERFYRVDRARSRELGGTGLGLSIVKHLAQSFGGVVGVRSEVGAGSVFWVRLPRSTKPSPQT